MDRNKVARFEQRREAVWKPWVGGAAFGVYLFVMILYAMGAL